MASRALGIGSVQAAADYNHDGRADILWRNTNGDTLIWNSNPGAAESFSYQDLGTATSPGGYRKWDKPARDADRIEVRRGS